MFYILSKTIDVLLMPLPLAFAAFLYAFFTKNKVRGRRVFLSVLGLLYLASSPIFVNQLLRWWEYKGKTPSEIGKVYEVGVLLTGGMAKAEVWQPPHIWVGVSFDRAAQAFQLYKAGKIRKILISGGQGRISGSEKGGSEGRSIRQYLIASGVPAAAILLEPKSRNTHENALFSAQILQKQLNTNECVLITSAFHLARAEGCFKKAGIATNPFAASFLQQTQRIWVDSFFPNEESFNFFAALWHEWLGYVVYKVLGYS